MTMPDQFLDLAHPAAEMIPAAAAHAALHGLVTQQAVADLDRGNIPRKTLRTPGLVSPICRSSPFIRTDETIHRFSFAICPKRPKRLIVAEVEGVTFTFCALFPPIFAVVMQWRNDRSDALFRAASKLDDRETSGIPGPFDFYWERPVL
ncbi:hypothetical protein [Rhizobium aethiopicum]|uniref:hypothetical protein n=1 Tax=Rhizobium aethiopicum TaxID=1138170 RepID=UPI001FEEA643|nr:hypothetical protein [Rhizobium aethiopicum]